MAGIKGGDKLEKALADIARRIGKGGAVNVGFLENAKYPDGTSVAQVAAFDNFGTSTAPARPFFSNMVEEKSPDWGPALAKCLEATSNDVPAALALMGEGIKGQLQDAIRNFDGIPLSDVTLLLRSRFPTRDGMTAADVWQAFHDVAAGMTAGAASEQELVWSGVMLGSVDYEVIER